MNHQKPQRPHREFSLQIMVTAEQKSKFEQAAAQKGLSVSTFVLMTMLPAVEEQLRGSP